MSAVGPESAGAAVAGGGPTRDRGWGIDRAGEIPPNVSVILPVRDEAATLAEAILPLLGGDHPLDRLEILVVDGGSTDGTREVAERIAASNPAARVRLLDNPEGITPAALNRGIQAAMGEVIVRMDGHARPAPDYIPRCLSALRSSGAWVVGGTMRGVGDTAFGRSVALAGRHPLGSGGADFRRSGGPARAVDTVYLGAWPREALEILGGFDPALRRNQDSELCLRVRARGGRVWLDPAIRSTTRVRGTPAALARQYLGYGRGRAATFLRHPRSLRPRQALPALFVALLAFAPLAWVLARRLDSAGLHLGFGFGAGAGVGIEFGLATALALVLAAYPAAILLATLQLAAHPDATWRDALRLPIVFPLMHLPWGIGFWLGLVEEGLRRTGRRR